MGKYERAAVDMKRLLVERRNWGRWGDDDEIGTLNLIDSRKRVESARLVQSGRAVSLARPFPTRPGGGNPDPAHLFFTTGREAHGGGYACDHLEVGCHGLATTHLDALCHVWDSHGLYNGRDPQSSIGFRGARFGDIGAWSEGIFTRGVIMDVPRHRGVPYVDIGQPVQGEELNDICRQRGVAVAPGDALCVFSGREAWQEANPDKPYGSWKPDGVLAKPGLHASCLEFLRDNDVGVLIWDMLDEWPTELEVPWTVHGAIHAYGLALLDNALLEPLAAACEDEDRDEFLLTCAPLVLKGATGSIVNPIALF